ARDRDRVAALAMTHLTSSRGAQRRSDLDARFRDPLECAQLPDASAAPSPQTGGPTLARRLGPIDATLVVMGGIIGSGIFMNPALVAREVHTPALILGAWLVGGVIAVLGAFVWAELASRRPQVGG